MCREKWLEIRSISILKRLFWDLLGVRGGGGLVGDLESLEYSWYGARRGTVVDRQWSVGDGRQMSPSSVNQSSRSSV